MFRPIKPSRLPADHVRDDWFDFALELTESVVTSTGMTAASSSQDPDPQQRAHSAVGHHAAKPTPARAWGSDQLVRQSTRRFTRCLSTHAGRSQLCHAIQEPGGHGGTREDKTSSAIEYRRTRKEAPGYGRTHRCAGSGP